VVDDAEFAALKAQVAQQGRLIEVLFAHVGLGQLDAAAQPSADGAYPDVVEAIRAGNTIEAIKRHRAHTNAGLKQSKDFVDDLARRLGL